MKSLHRPSIGVFINKSDSYFENSTYLIAQQKARELGYDIYFFGTVGYRDSINTYDIHENTMFSFAPIRNMDGLLVAPDNYELQGFKDSLFNMLNSYSGPIVCIRCRNEKYSSLYTDEENAIRPLIKHILDDHQLKNVCFLAGYKGHIDGEKRLACYLDEMEKRGYEIPEGAVYYGDMWTNCGEQAYRHYFEELPVRPEAIICANDYMARALCSACAGHGLRVPEDVIITGFDNIDDTDTPKLTTIGQNYENMIGEAMLLLDKKIREKADGIDSGAEYIALPGQLIVRESCGCIKPDPEAYRVMTRKMGNTINSMINREVSQTYFSILMNSCKSHREVHEAIASKIDDIPTLRDYYMCLFSDDSPDDESFDYAEDIRPNVRLVSAIRDRQDMGMPMTIFDYQNILPRIAYREEPQAFFVILLHQNDAVYGYSVTQYYPGEIPTRFYLHWNVIVSTALSNIASQHMLRTLYEERRLSSITDHLTALLNRRGLEEKLQPEWQELARKKTDIAFIMLDMDDMKQINDTWGHLEGDRALCYVAIAINRAMNPGMLGARMGGDEFLVYMPNASQEKCAAYINRFETLLTNLTRVDKKPYTLKMSSGYTVTKISEETQIEDCIRACDMKMYEEKTRRKIALGRRKEDRAAK